MHTFTDEEKTELENKEEYITTKEKLLKEYKSYEEDLDFANDDFEEEIIQNKRDKLSHKIKDLSAKLRNIESLEKMA